jgi:release factor glutamine methyltransferase
MPETVADLLATARGRLASAPFAPSTREAALLLGHVLGWSEAQVLARGDATVPDEARRSYGALVERRLTGEPVAYLVGMKEFYGRPFAVDDRVLIPRPETEHLVEAALALDLPPGALVLDLGTGSGCLAVTLAVEIPEARAVAVDLSPAAGAVALANARRHGVEERVRVIAGDLVSALDVGPFDLVVSNPPYVGREEAAGLSLEVTGFEPDRALFAGSEGLEVLARLLEDLSALRPGTPVFLEIGYRQGDRVAELAAAGPLRLEGIDRDLAGHPRIARLRR